MIIKKKDRVKHENSPNCTVFEYPLDNKNIDVAVAQINGRYPDNGYAMNEKVNEMVYVVEGNGKIVIEQKEYPLNEGDAVLIEPKQKYYFDGKLKIIISCNPAWSPDQYKMGIQ